MTAIIVPYSFAVTLGYIFSNLESEIFTVLSQCHTLCYIVISLKIFRFNTFTFLYPYYEQHSMKTTVHR